MPIDVEALAIPDVRIIRPKKFGDARGFFSETYNKQAFADAGVALEFVQDNHSLSAPVGTIRGLHSQVAPFAQDKLVRVTKGRVWDVAVDVRKGSPTFGRWVAAEISAQEWNQILVPVGFLHAFCTLEPDTEVIYKVTALYSAKHEVGIRWNDPDLKIAWPIGDDKVTLSDKDRVLPLFKDVFGKPA
jgi:dTDP-4-dehydrorhamnose 3,5-epimerase